MHVGPLAERRSGSAQRYLAPVIDAIGRPRFEAVALAELNRMLSVGSWAVYQLWRDKPPVLHLSASHGIAATARHCLSIYRDQGLYRRDTSFEAVLHERPQADALRRPPPEGVSQLGSGPSLTHECRDQHARLRMDGDEAANSDHRSAIYVRRGSLERLSVARLENDGSLLTVNLYHHSDQGFDAGEVESFSEIAPALLVCVARHVEWLNTESAAAARTLLRQRCAKLTDRELDVLERLLRGLTYDGIAADMGLSVSTVKTYRARAFMRLNIHFKNELFASFVPTACRLFG